MAVLAVVPSPAVTAAPLHVIEDQLACLIETAEMVSPEQEQEQEFRAEFQTALTAAVEKTRPGRPISGSSGAANRLCQIRDRPPQTTQSDLRTSPRTT